MSSLRKWTVEASSPSLRCNTRMCFMGFPFLMAGVRSNHRARAHIVVLHTIPQTEDFVYDVGQESRWDSSCHPRIDSNTRMPEMERVLFGQLYRRRRLWTVSR